MRGVDTDFVRCRLLHLLLCAGDGAMAIEGIPTGLSDAL